MQAEFLVNDGEVSLLLSADGIMEEELLKQLLKQDNEISEVRSTVVVLNKTFKNGVFIGKKTLNLAVDSEKKSEEDKKD